jgi:[NiFe] hydrogenase assembly HybE family chaperone
VSCPDHLSEGLEQVFGRIHQERMLGLPIINPALQVQAVGFRQWQGHRLGVLITPWFMNLMLLPGEDDDWQNLRLGDKQLHQLPSGPYEFILGEEPGIGRYQMCSLFSPVFEFADQETAEATAKAAMTALMEVENRETLSTREPEIERHWRGEAQGESETSSEKASENDVQEFTATGERLQQPLSRRDLLRGRLIRDGRT